MADVTLFEDKDFEIYHTRHSLYIDNDLHNELKIKKYSFLLEIINLDFNQLKIHLLSDNDFSSKCKLVDNTISDYILKKHNPKHKNNFACTLNKALGSSLIKSNCISSNAVSLISYFISSFFSKIEKDDLSKKNDSKQLIIQYFDELQNIVDFIKLYYYKFNDIDKFKFILKGVLNKISTTSISQINIYALFDDEDIDEFIKKFSNYPKNIDFFYEKVQSDDKNSLQFKIVNEYYHDQHSNNPKIESIYDFNLNKDEVFKYFELIYPNQQILKKYNIYKFFNFHEYFEIIFQSMFQNKQKLKKCPNCNEFFITDKGRSGNAQKFCKKCRNNVDTLDIKKEAYRFNNNYEKKFENLNSIKDDVEDFNKFTKTLKDNILANIKKDNLKIVNTIISCNDSNEKDNLIYICNEWRKLNNSIYKKGYIKEIYQNSKLNDDIVCKNNFALQYYKLDSNFTMKLKTISIDIERTIIDGNEIIEYKTLDAE